MAKLRVCATSDIKRGGALRVDVDGTPVAVVNIDGTFYALGDTCSHEEASLSEGYVEEEDMIIECPKHGAQFDLRTGTQQSLPATKPVASFAVTVEGDDIYVEANPT